MRGGTEEGGEDEGGGKGKRKGGGDHSTHQKYWVPVEVIFSWQKLATFDPSEWRVCCRCMLFCRSVLTVLLCRRKGLGDTYPSTAPIPSAFPFISSARSLVPPPGPYNPGFSEAPLLSF